MPMYEVSTKLAEAAEQFSFLASGLRKAEKGIDHLLSEWQEGLEAFKPKLVGSAAAISGITAKSRDMEAALIEIIAVYAKAEQSAFTGDNGPDGSPAPAGNGARREAPRIRMPSGSVIFNNDLVMPDWLMASVLDYMRFKDETMEGPGPNGV